MRRAFSLLALELRLQRRYGILAVAAALAVLWTGLLLLTPPGVARAITPMVVFADSATAGGFLCAAMVLFERGERTLTALLVTPVTVAGYVWTKVASFTTIAVLVAAPVAAAGGRLQLQAAPVLAGVVLTAVLLLDCCIALAARHRSLTSFLTVAPWPLALMMGVPLAHLVRLWDHPVTYLVPTVAAAELIAAGFDLHAVRDVPALPVAYAVFAAAAGGWLAARRLGSAVRELGG